MKIKLHRLKIPNISKSKKKLNLDSVRWSLDAIQPMALGRNNSGPVYSNVFELFRTDIGVLNHNKGISDRNNSNIVNSVQLDEIEKPDFDLLKNDNLIAKLSDHRLREYLESQLNFYDKKLVLISDTDNIDNYKLGDISSVICLQKVNNIRYVNKYFEKVNSKLPVGGNFIGCLETLRARKKRKRIYKIPVLGNVYFYLEFLFKRIFPKLSLTKKVYFDITKGKNRLLSKAEGLGRLVSSGFEIVDFKTIDGLLYFVVKKVADPIFDMSPSYGPLYAMPRLGKNGKIIKVYKFRTMHPYSEYLQDYIIRNNGYSESGKPANDFRIPSWGKFIRKYWIDELPQLLNVLKGEMKLVGIRPVSERYFQDIPTEMQKLRLTQKPGCIPPYVCLNRKSNVMSVLQAEKDYLVEKINNPHTTDIKYFFSALYNIIVKHKRSA